jgi:hypothetical protein
MLDYATKITTYFLNRNMHCKKHHFHHHWQIALSKPQPSLEGSVRFVHSWELDYQVFTYFDIATVIVSQSKAASPASNPQPGRPGVFIYVSR